MRAGAVGCYGAVEIGTALQAPSARAAAGISGGLACSPSRPPPMLCGYGPFPVAAVPRDCMAADLWR